MKILKMLPLGNLKILLLGIWKKYSYWGRIKKRLKNNKERLNK